MRKNFKIGEIKAVFNKLNLNFHDFLKTVSHESVELDQSDYLCHLPEDIRNTEYEWNESV